MTSLVVRRLMVDLSRPFDRHWNGGDAFRTAYFNALSMSFPVGEQFFIDSVRQGVKALPPEQQPRFAAEVQGFIGQEATHRRIHGLFNDQLAAQGYVNAWEGRIRERLKRLEGLDVRHWVAATAATEHFTAFLAEHLLANPESLEGTEERMKTVWLWHASEESEHRSTAFDLYRALGGNEKWRRRWFYIVSFNFWRDALRQTMANLRQDKLLWKWSTWKSAASFFFGRHGLVRQTFVPWLEYVRADFHPSKQGGELGPRWLREHESAWRAVGETPATAAGMPAAIPASA